MYEKLERSRQNLMNTGLFNTVTVIPVYLDRYQVMVEVVVNERWYLWPSLDLRPRRPQLQHVVADQGLRPGELRSLPLPLQHARPERDRLHQSTVRLHATIRLHGTKCPTWMQRQRWGFSVGGSYDQQAEVTAGTVDNEAHPDPQLRRKQPR